MRYLERLASHDVALRVLGRVASSVLCAHRAARAGAARWLPARRSALAHGRGRRRAAGPLSARPRTAARGAARGRRRGWRRRRPAAASRGSCWRLACSPPGSPCPRCRAALARSGRTAAGNARGELSADLVELIRGRPRARRLRRRACRAGTRARRRRRAREARPPRRARHRHRRRLWGSRDRHHGRRRARRSRSTRLPMASSTPS